MGVDFGKDEKNRLFIRIDGSLDSLNAPEVYSQVEERLQGHSGDVVFDFGSLEYISSAGLQVLLMAAKTMKQKGNEVWVKNPNGMVDEVLRISGFYSFLGKMD